jgi:diadenylate cyclase
MLIFLSHWWRTLLEIWLICLIFYYSYLSFRGTRALQVSKGLVLLLVVFDMAKRLELSTLTFILGKVFGVAILAIVILFQPEIRRAFAALGRTKNHFIIEEGERLIQVLIQVLNLLSEKKVGALIVVCNENSLQPYIDTGVKMDSLTSPEILVTLFSPRTPLHDGAVIIDGNRIVAASCLLPLSQRVGIKRSYGTRHRAALGLSEETDAVILTVSEENGQISLASGGKIKQVEPSSLKRSLNHHFQVKHTTPKMKQHRILQRLFGSEKKN